MFRVAVALVLALAAAGSAAATEPGCTMPGPAADAGALPRAAAALKGGRLDILAIGPATALGARGRPEGSFPDAMAQALRVALPGTDVRLTLEGERGMGVAAMLALLRRNLPTQHPTLVLWQTGTVEALRKTPPEEFGHDLDAGAVATRQAGADLVLIDQQYSRMLMAHAEVAPYRQAIEDAARRNGALLFDRFELVRHWAETGELDLESVPRDERAQAAGRLNACLGRALAAAVLRGAS